MQNNISITPDFLKGTYKEYKKYTKYYAKSFYFSSFALPKEKRYASYAIYAFCRYADNITDVSEYESEEFLEQKIQYLLNILDEVYKQTEHSDFLSDFTKTIKKYNIPKEYFIELVEGVATDIHKKRYSDFGELDIYCYKVASVVGLIMTKIFGYTNPRALDYAIALGKAMQLTNILRDIKDDFSIGRIYLPKNELYTFNYTENDIKRNVVDERFYALMNFQITRAREYYAEAYKGIKFLTNDGSSSTVKMMIKIYSGILNEIEKNNYDIYSKRHYVSTFSKIIMTLKIIFNKKSKESENYFADFIYENN